MPSGYFWEEDGAGFEEESELAVFAPDEPLSFSFVSDFVCFSSVDDFSVPSDDAACPSLGLRA